jgi:Major Facilitator Superfamily
LQLKSENAKLAVLLLVAMGYRSTSNMLQTTIPLYLKYELSTSDFVISLVVTILGLSAMVFLMYTTIRQSDVRKRLLVSLAIVAIGLPGFLIAKDLVFFVILTSILYFGTGSILVLLVTAVVLVGSPKAQERNIILFTVVLSLSLVLSPIFQAGILTLLSGNLAYSMVSFAPLVAVSILLISSVKVQQDDKNSNDNVQQSKTTSRLIDFGFFKNRKFILGVLTNQIYTMPFIAITTYGGIFARDRFAISYSNVEILFSFFFVTSFLSRLLLLRLRPYKHAAVVSVISFTIAGLALIYLSSSLPDLSVGFILLGYARARSFLSGRTKLHCRIIA